MASVGCTPLEVLLAPSLLEALREWRKPCWVGSCAPYPGSFRLVADAWYQGAPLRALLSEEA
jgi:hypothetical protein